MKVWCIKEPDGFLNHATACCTPEDRVGQFWDKKWQMDRRDLKKDKQ